MECDRPHAGCFRFSSAKRCTAARQSPPRLIAGLGASAAWAHAARLMARVTASSAKAPLRFRIMAAKRLLLRASLSTLLSAATSNPDWHCDETPFLTDGRATIVRERYP